MQKPRDPRYYQIAVLGSLLLFAVTRLGVNVSLLVMGAIFATSMLTQLAASRTLALSFEWRSAVITACSLTLLLRTGDAWLGALAAVIAIGSKFLLRANRKHLFNPANLGLVIVSLLFDAAWISTGQWGQATWFALLIAGIGMFVTTRSSRADIVLMFLGCYSALLLTRALWLGDPLPVPLHQLQNGALLIFAFFMISDPGSTPDSRAGRLLFAAITALLAVIIQFLFYQPVGIIYALVLTCPLTPLLDRYWPGPRFHWQPTPP